VERLGKEGNEEMAGDEFELNPECCRVAPSVQRAASSKYFVGACAVPGILCGRAACAAAEPVWALRY
jgi:hypothetical protein